MKRHLTSGMVGICIGLLMSIVVSYFVAPTYLPMNPYSLVGQWVQEHQIHGSLVLLYCMLIWFIIAFLFEFANSFFQRDWSLLKVAVLHYIVTVLGFVPLSILAGWYPVTLGSIIGLIIGFTLIYLLVWVVSYVIQKRKIQEINEKLTNK